MGICVGASLLCLGKLSLHAGVFPVMDPRLFAWSELALWMWRQNVSISYSNDFTQGLCAKVGVSA